MKKYILCIYSSYFGGTYTFTKIDNVCVTTQSCLGQRIVQRRNR